MTNPQAMPAPLAEAHAALWQDVVLLHTKWSIYSRLFGSAESVKILNTISGQFFGIMQNIWADDVVLGIARLTDPSSTRSQNNLSLNRMLISIDRTNPPGLYSRVDQLLSELKAKSEPIRTRRNKLLAHPDLDTKLRRSVPLPPVTKGVMDQAFQVIREVMNEVQRAYSDSTTLFELAESLEADELLYALKEAALYRRQVKESMGVPSQTDVEPEA